MVRKLKTTTEVIEALGGIQATADIAKTTYSNAANWNSWLDYFPPKFHPAMTRELARRGYTADDSLWRVIE